MLYKKKYFINLFFIRLLKDALLENQKNQINYVHSTNLSKDSINSSDDYVSNILINCNQSDITQR